MCCVLSYDGYEIRRLVVQSLGEMFVEGDEVGDVNIAVILSRQYILSHLVAVDEDVVEVKVEDEVDELLLDLAIALLATGGAAVLAEERQRVHGLAVHRRRYLEGGG